MQFGDNFSMMAKDDMNVPLVSVLMPTYNRSTYLKIAIESVISQSFRDFELIITDNCSTDDTRNVVESTKDDRIKYVLNDVNLGAVGNYNKALRMSRGKYYYFFSDDDVMYENNLLQKVEVLETHVNVGLVHSNVNVINAKGEILSEHWAIQGKRWKEVTKKPVLAKALAFDILYHNWNFISMPSVMVRADIIIRNKIEFNNQLNYLVDWDFWLRMALFGDFYYLPNALISYRTHDNSETNILGRNWMAHFNEIIILKLSIKNKFFDCIQHKSLLSDIISTISQLKEAKVRSAPRSMLKYFFNI